MEENGKLVQFLFNQEKEAVTETEEDTINRLIWGSGLIARNTDAECARTYYHYASDEMGSITHLTDEDGEVQNRYVYDVQGNLLEETGSKGKRYVYDSLNRLNRVTTDTAVWKNHYDGESLQYEAEENDKVIRFVFDRGELSAEENAEGSIRYIHGSNGVVCSERQGTGFGYHIRDEAGSTLFVLDREQKIRKAYRYDAFGKPLEERGDIENRLTYTGQMYDGATGQYYLRARFYNPVIGRFFQEDVYRGDGLNLYAYCANNLVMYYDPSGYVGLCPEGKMNPGKGEGGSGSLIDINKIRPQLKTEPDTAFFWSGRTEGIGGADTAANIAKSRGGVTLESTIDAKKIVMPEWDFNNPSTMEAWDLVSGAYAEQVSGEIRAVVGSELRQGNIWENIELPRLMNNARVTKITTIDPKTQVETIIFKR